VPTSSPRPRRKAQFLTTSALAEVVVAALAALVLLPPISGRRMEGLRTIQDETVTPARRHVAAISQSLALEIAAARGFALTADPSHAQSFEAALAAEEKELAELRKLLPRLGAAAERAGERLERDKARWLGPVRELMRGERAPGAYTSILSAQQDRFEAVLSDLRALDDAIVAYGSSIREEVREERRAEQRVIVISVIVAALAILALSVVVQRQQRLARQLRYRADEERALRQVARTLTAASTVREVVQQVVDAAVRTTRAFGAYVEQVEETEVVVLSAAGQGGPPVGLRVPYPGSLTKAVLESGEPEILREIASLGDSMAAYVRDRCADCTALVAPMVAEGRSVGALVLLRSPDQESFTTHEAAHARALGDLAAAAIRRLELLEQALHEREALRASEQQFRSLAEHTNAAVMVISDDNTVLFANAMTEQIFGWPVEQIVGEPLTKLMPESMRARHRAGVERYLRTGRRNMNWENARLPGLHRDGREIPLEVTLGEFEREGRRYFTGIARDVSERYKAEEERDRLLQAERLARQEVEAAIQNRDDVLAIVSHDLRNPLNTISLGLATMRDLPPDRQQIAVATVRRAVDRMNRLIQDLLDVTRLGAGRKLPFNLQDVDVLAVVAEACEAFRAEAQSKRVRLEAPTADPLPAVRADRDRVLQVLSNLLGNALKFTPEDGQVTVSARGIDDAVEVQVADTGPGIPEGEQARVFDAFWQARRTARLGAGLGLAISKGIVESHGGSIRVESRPGLGTTFVFTLPVAGPPADEPTDAAREVAVT
jgi:PAS domain S-box-containing protein